MHRTILTALVVSLILTFLPVSHASAQTNAFTYQGSLSDSGGMADGIYDFQCSLFSAPSGGTPIGNLTLTGVEIVDGLFTLELDFPSGFTSGTDRYLQLEVRRDGETQFTTLDPRTRLDSVPFAAHADRADIATFAFNGPFQPEDTTPTSTSGTTQQTITYTLVIDGVNYQQPFEVQYPIRISRDVIHDFSGTFPGNFDDFQIRLTKRHNINDQWYQHFAQAVNHVTLTIDVTSSSNNATTYTFENGIVSGYEFGHDGQTTETLIINYAPDGGNPFLIADRVSRDASGVINRHGNTPPELGGETLLPGLLKYRSEQVDLEYSGAGSLPSEQRLFSAGFPLNAFEAAPLENLLNLHDDANNTLWDRFADSTQTQPLELRNQTGIIWTPGVSNPTNAVISAWVLDMADDGGLFETYIFEYDPNAFVP